MKWLNYSLFSQGGDLINAIQLKDTFTLFNESTPGIGVLANHKGRVVYQDTLGLANCEHRIPLTLESVFNLASVSKQFTGIAILQLMERRELLAEDKLVRFIPEPQHYAGEVTIEQLANHFSRADRLLPLSIPPANR